MSKTQGVAAIFVVAILLLHTPVCGESTPVLRELGAMSPATAPVELATQPVTVQVPMREDARAQIEAAIAPSSKTALTLAVEGVQYGTPGVHYEVYLNLPKNEKPNYNYKSAHFVGNLAPFLPRAGGNERLYTVRFGITKNVRELRSLKAWNNEQLSVTFVMRGLVDREGRQLPVPPGVRQRVNNLKVAAVTPQ